MKKFLALVNREGKILQEYADQQLRLYGVVKSFYCYDETVQIEESDEMINSEKCKQYNVLVLTFNGV